MRVILLIVFALRVSVFGDPNPDSVRENQRVTVEMHPELGIKDSPLNKRFLERVQKYREEKSKIFDSYDWPYRIAEECVKEIKLDQKASESLKKAAKLYPDIQREESPLHQLFVKRSKEYLELHTTLPAPEDWPFYVAEKCVEELRREKEHLTAPAAISRGRENSPDTASGWASRPSSATTNVPAGETKNADRGGSVIGIVVALIAIVVLVRSPAKFFRIVVDIFGLKSVQELGGTLLGARHPEGGQSAKQRPTSSSQAPKLPPTIKPAPKQPPTVKTYEVRMVVDRRPFRTVISAMNASEATSLIAIMYPGARNVHVNETRQ